MFVMTTKLLSSVSNAYPNALSPFLSITNAELQGNRLCIAHDYRRRPECKSMVLARANYNTLANSAYKMSNVLTLVLCTSFQMTIGTMKSGIPMYDAMKSPVFQLPFKKTGKPVIKVMIVDPMKPYHAVKGWKGLFQGKLSRLSPCAFMAA